MSERINMAGSAVVLVVCAWCDCYLSGDYRAERVSHGICRDCSSGLEENPWVVWQDTGGEG